jgi:hypothetical protein
MNAGPGSTKWGPPALSLATALAVATLGIGMAGCGDPGADVKSPAALGLPPWDDHARAVFDDNIDPAAVGYTMDAMSARSDRFLRERAQTGELVGRLLVKTAGVSSVGDEATYQIGVQVIPPLFGPNPKIEDRNLDLVIKPSSPAFGIAKALDRRIQGLTFIGFIRRFASADGSDIELHWHLSPDTADVAEAVKEAEALAAASGR